MNKCWLALFVLSIATAALATLTTSPPVYAVTEVSKILLQNACFANKDYVIVHYL